MNILFASSEVAPFAKTGGLADVAGSLPKALNDIGCKTRVILPFYRCVKALNLEAEPMSCGEFSFLKHSENGVEYIFVVNDDLYDRENLYSEPTGDYPDNYLRFSYYSRAIVELATKSQPIPDIINCNDWQTGLVPLYLKIKNSDIKTLFSIHNIAYQGIFKKEILEEIGVPRDFYTMDGIEYYGKVCFLKSGLVYSTAISTVSKKYGEEILTKEFGCGMDGILRMRKSDLYGILNGVDYSHWDPEIDKLIACSYSSETVEKKLICKKDLIESVKLPADTINRPLVGIISRLAEQKGIDLLVEAAGDIIKLGASIVILGTGDEKYNKLCRHIAEQFPEYISS
ncbi:MAG: glycogen/starch synthase, partial [Candidatus Omnitrophota bacterium]